MKNHILKHHMNIKKGESLLPVTDLEGDLDFFINYLAQARQYYISNLGLRLQKNDFCLVKKKAEVEYVQIPEKTSFLNCGDLFDNTRASTKNNPSKDRNFYNNIRLLQIMVNTKEHYGDHRDIVYIVGNRDIGAKTARLKKELCIPYIHHVLDLEINARQANLHQTTGYERDVSMPWVDSDAPNFLQFLEKELSILLKDNLTSIAAITDLFKKFDEQKQKLYYLKWMAANVWSAPTLFYDVSQELCADIDDKEQRELATLEKFEDIFCKNGGLAHRYAKQCQLATIIDGKFLATHSGVNSFSLPLNIDKILTKDEIQDAFGVNITNINLHRHLKYDEENPLRLVANTPGEFVKALNYWYQHVVDYIYAPSIESKVIMDAAQDELISMGMGHPIAKATVMTNSLIRNRVFRNQLPHDTYWKLRKHGIIGFIFGHQPNLYSSIVRLGLLYLIGIDTCNYRVGTAPNLTIFNKKHEALSVETFCVNPDCLSTNISRRLTWNKHGERLFIQKNEEFIGTLVMIENIPFQVLGYKNHKFLLVYENRGEPETKILNPALPSQKRQFETIKNYANKAYWIHETKLTNAIKQNKANFKFAKNVEFNLNKIEIEAELIKSCFDYQCYQAFVENNNPLVIILLMLSIGVGIKKLCDEIFIKPSSVTLLITIPIYTALTLSTLSGFFAKCKIDHKEMLIQNEYNNLKNKVTNKDSDPDITYFTKTPLSC